MKKFDIKSIIVGLVIGAIGVSSIFFITREFKSKNNTATTSAVRERESLISNSQVDINSGEGAKSSSSNKDKVCFNENDIEVKPDISQNEADKEAIEIIQKTGNWGYIDRYISHMSDDGIERAVEIYNSKHINACEHKKACNYIKR